MRVVIAGGPQDHPKVSYRVPSANTHLCVIALAERLARDFSRHTAG
jgi:hypothetical protein